MTTFALRLVFTLIALPCCIALITVARSKLSARSSTLKMTFSFGDDRNIDNNDNGTSRRSLRLSERAAERLETSQVSNILETSKQLLTIGVLADIQHAPVPDGASWKGQPRYYQYALEQARTAAQHFQDEQVSLLINLGDIIDGKCASVINGNKAIDSVLEALSVYTHGPILHTYGNHELYVLGREEIFHKLEIPFVTESPSCELVGYYSFVESNIRFVVLDSYDIALMGRCPQTSVKRKEAEYWLSTNNPNYPSEENSPQGLRGLKQRFVAFNGAVGSAQLEWLRTTLRMAKSNKEKVIVLSHQPILPGSSSPLCLIWNYNDVLQILRQYSCTVMASFAGHAHRGGYARDRKSGIHFRVFESVLETPRPHTTYGFVDIHEDFIRVRGIGECNSAIYDFSHMSQSIMSI
mmetsp:Transcript_12187/g.17563  ORF Transcript_12187/g.17563 Transcript_12187/m.17563 type:complete len:409 (-) Transcript_12187:20-1246(-)